MGRTFGLQRQQIGGREVENIHITRALVGRVLQHFKPYWVQWAIIFVCIVISVGLGLLPPLVVRAILDNAIPNKDTACSTCWQALLLA